MVGNPWTDEKWAGYKWTVYRGVAYDLTSFIEKHPAGNWLIRLGLGRDCTALFESYHLRPEVSRSMMQLSRSGSSPEGRHACRRASFWFRVWT